MRMLKRLFILLVVLGLFFVKGAYSLSDPDYADDAIILKLKTGMLTEAEFPENIANVAKSVSGEILQIETLGNRMFLLPKGNLDSYISVVTGDSISYSLHLVTTEKEASTRIKIRKSDQTQSQAEKSSQTANTVELIKGLINGSMSKYPSSSRLHPQEVFNDGRLRIIIDEVYELGAGVKAFVMTFENLSPRPIVVPIEHIELSGLLAISLDSQVLEARPQEPKGKPSSYTTKAYMIVEGKGQ